ncbi:MAG: DinB family protein [Planctomycetales bacterium]
MAAKEILRYQLLAAREFSERLLASFETREQWTYVLKKGLSGALWFARHMGNYDNWSILFLKPEAFVQRDFEHCEDGDKEFPPTDVVVDFMRKRRKVLLSILDEMDEADLDLPPVGDAPDHLPTNAHVFQTASWHEGVHAGQVAYTRWALKYPTVELEDVFRETLGLDPVTESADK